MTLSRLLLAFFFATILPICFVKAQQDNETAAIKRGNELVAREQYDAALREYGSISPAAGDLYARALYNMGVCYYELWQTDRAIDFYSRAIAASKNNYPKASYALGVALEDDDRFAEAALAYQKSISDSRETYSAAQFRLGLLMVRRGDYAFAVRLFKEAIKRSGDHLPASHNNLGVVLAWSGRLAEAEREFKAALRLTDGTMEDAAQNLKLCWHLISRRTGTSSSRTAEVKQPKLTFPAVAVEERSNEKALRDFRIAFDERTSEKDKRVEVGRNCVKNLKHQRSE